MVRGIEKFQYHFREFTDKYVIIGGTACDIAMNELDLKFRATKDIDIVLCLETIDTQFVIAFWDFIRAGGYKNRQKSSNLNIFYRFDSPEDPDFPVMIELFSRIPDAIAYTNSGHLTPIPMDEEVSSLSAILLDDAYYHFITSGKIVINNLSIAKPEFIIPLKARAWLDLTDRRKQSVNVDSRDIKKHKNDVFRLFSIVNLDTKIQIPEKISIDLKRFIGTVDEVNLKSLGIANTSIDKFISEFIKFYNINF